MLSAISIYRFAHGLHRRGLSTAARALTTVNRLIFAAHIPAEATIGEACELGYGGIGVIVHKDAVIGRDVLLSPGVVIGGRSGIEGAPKIGDSVKIGSGAKVLGPITVGEGAQIGANAVVIHDVPAGDTVAGVPAKSIRKRSPLKTAAAQ